ncbi:glycosyltransferase [Nocardioides sp. Kera G14]|uniref:glycosyltransferase n=1 Tax=Nocardioides sp. Kera G14 TaxID=2884264 RepID=UPI001D117F9C|nr:glycosyltransferase [Nocardioides sp. Kera G14]UDY22660.1 glycosyltransferase [Nocardioides sp. Kera G14]
MGLLRSLLRLPPTPDEDEQRLLDSPLFDEEWYAGQADTAFTSRLEAVRHYLAEGVRQRWQPGPLVDPVWLKGRWDLARQARVGRRDPLGIYLKRQLWRFPTHPLVDVEHYLAQRPQALGDPDGPMGDYLRAGRDAGARINDWLDVDPVDWLRRQRDLVERPVADPPEAAAVHAALPWDELAARQQDEAVVSVIIPTYDDLAMTWSAVDTVTAAGAPAGRTLEVLVWDNGSRPEIAAGIRALELRHRQEVQVLRSPVNLGFSVGNDAALPAAHGAVVLFLNNDTTVPEGWLEPLLARLDEPGVLGVQPLLIYPSGAVQSAGVAFPSTGGLPHQLLQGFPIEDAAAVDALGLHALTGAGLMLRWDDVVAARGFDPAFVNGMEDVDLCQRIEAARPGAFRVVTARPVTHHESRSKGRYRRYKENRRRWLDRWGDGPLAADDERLWAAAGFRVVGHERRSKDPDADPRLLVPEPVIEPELRFHTSPRPLRWAIKNPAVSGPAGDLWGDTHFADALAVALRELGQQVVIDRRGEFERSSRVHDDVELLIRGRLPLAVATDGPASIAWVISHPELVTAEELSSYDRVLAASEGWAAQRGAEWGIRIDPLMQATDAARFTPDAPATSVDDGELLFVGSTTGRTRRIVGDALAVGLRPAVYGSGWEGLLPDGVLRASYLANDDLPSSYRSARVVLNDHWDDMRAAAFISNRVFDAVACGARVISDHVDGLSELFGPAVQTYRTPEELLALATATDLDAVFGSTAERLALAAEVRRLHSFHARAVTLVEIAQALVQERAANSPR